MTRAEMFFHQIAANDVELLFKAQLTGRLAGPKEKATRVEARYPWVRVCSIGGKGAK